MSLTETKHEAKQSVPPSYIWVVVQKRYAFSQGVGAYLSIPSLRSAYPNIQKIDDKTYGDCDVNGNGFKAYRVALK